MAVNVKNQSIELEFTEISKMKEIWSPDFFIHGIPWNVRLYKKDEEEKQWLAVFLHCANKDEKVDWAVSAMASFKLMPFSNIDADARKYHTEPHVFDYSGTGYGTSCFITWNDLFNQNKSYVRDDKINVEIKVEAENQKDPNRSRLNFQCVRKCCDDSNSGTFRLTVKNFGNLLAVLSPKFTLFGLPWVVEIIKKRSSHLGVLLKLEQNPGNKAVKNTMSIKLVSTKEGGRSIEICDTKQYQYSKNYKILPVVSWIELMKPENGYVNDNSITLEITIESNEPDDANDMPTAKRAKLDPATGANSLQLECPICLKSINKQHLSATPCGHMFCFDCIDKAVAKRAVCPMCNKVARKNTLRRIYLPFAN